ncbi:MAG: hypothetical protein P9M06_06360, partial [Candidatus Saelkia tenebricola]|nr:hypothetical protein [Candidatus Saelkia tenebricola]
DTYEICTVTALESVQVYQNFSNDNFSFTFTYNTEEGKTCWIRYEMVEYWIEDCERDFPPTEINENISRIIQFKSDGGGIRSSYHDRLKRHATLFHQKNERYLKKINRIMLSRNRSITTKLIRSTTEHLNQKEQIVLNKSALLSCELEDLLK